MYMPLEGAHAGHEDVFCGPMGDLIGGLALTARLGGYMAESCLVPAVGGRQLQAWCIGSAGAAYPGSVLTRAERDGQSGLTTCLPSAASGSLACGPAVSSPPLG